MTTPLSASPPEAFETAHAAIAALYGADAESRSRANEHLVRLQAETTMFSVALELLERCRGDSRVVFFAANALAGKVRERTFSTELDEAQRGELVRRMRESFAATSRDASCELASRRLAMGLANAATKLGPEAVKDIVSLGQTVASSAGVDDVAMRVGIELVACCAEEVDEAESTRRRALAQSCSSLTDGVLNMASQVFKAAGGASTKERDALRASCVRACHRWLKLDPSGDVGGGLSMSPTQLAVAHGELFANVLNCLAVESSGCGAAAVDMLVELHQGRCGTEQEEFQAMNAMTRGLLAHSTEASAPDNSALARNISLVAVSMSERCVGVIARGDDDSLALVSLLLNLMERHGREVTEVAIDFFLMLDTIGVTSRHEALRAPMHARLVEVMLRQSTLPDDFTSWDIAEEDEETFERFREHVLADLLDNCCGVLKGEYLSIVGNALGNAPNWRVAEAGTFALRAAAERIKEEMEESTTTTAEEFLTQLFTTVASQASDNSGIFSVHPLLRASTCRLINSYAFWLGKKGDKGTLARGILMYVTSSFSHGSSWPMAAVAFRSVCSRCARALRDLETFGALLEHTEQSISGIRVVVDGNDFSDNRTAVMEGLARVIATMQIQHASQVGPRLVSPIAGRCQAIAMEMTQQLPQHQIAHAEAARTMAAELSLIASSVRFLEFPSSSTATSGIEHPAIAVLSAAWPMLEEIVSAKMWQAPSVVKAISEIYIAALLSAKANSVNMVVPMLEAISRIFTATGYPSILEPIGTAVEMVSFSSENGASELLPNAPHVAAALTAAFAQVAQETTRLASADPLSPETWERAEALFVVARALVVFAPAHGLSNEALFPTLDLAIAALELREYPPVRASLALLNILIAPGEKSKASPPWIANAARVDEFFTTRGAKIVAVVLDSACTERMPRAAIRAGATLIATLLHTAPNAVFPWINDALVAYSLSAGRADDAERADDDVARPRLLAALSPARLPGPLPKPRCVSAICDYILIRQRVGDVDDLLAYDVD
jgi:transportin-3